MKMKTGRLTRECDAIEKMIRIHCAGQHASALCGKCADLLAYTNARLAACPFGDNKPVCGRCSDNCFDPAMRERIHRVMRYSGPRMLLRHPVVAGRHILDALSY